MRMLDDRGYLISKEELEASLDGFKQRFAPEGAVRRDQLTVLVRKKEDHLDKIFVFFPDDPKLGVKPIRKYCDMMKEHEVSRAVIVVQAGGMTPLRTHRPRRDGAQAHPGDVHRCGAARQHHRARGAFPSPLGLSEVSYRPVCHGAVVALEFQLLVLHLATLLLLAFGSALCIGRYVLLSAC